MNDPFVGTWTLNLTGSTFDANHQRRQGTMTWELDAGGYLLLAEGVDAKSERCSEKHSDCARTASRTPLRACPG